MLSQNVAYCTCSLCKYQCKSKLAVDLQGNCSKGFILSVYECMICNISHTENYVKGEDGWKRID